MKKIYLLLLVFFINFNTFGATCSSITYTSSSANTVLTSTKYNTDNSTIYNFINAYDAGCISANTLENDSLDTSTATGFAVPLNGIVDGCKVTQATAATLDIGKCIASVNNNWIKTATTTSVAWTDLDTGGEAASTFYYVYIDSTSDGTTLTPVISVTAPGTDGLNGSDRVLAKFYNDSSSNIVSTLSQWRGSEFALLEASARYDTDAGQSIDNASAEIINFDSTTFGYDDFSLVTTGASWKYTAIEDGEYHVGVYIRFVDSAAWGAGEQIYLDLHKNGTQVAALFTKEIEAAGTFLISAHGTTDIQLSAGDYIDVRVYQNSGGGLALSSGEETNWIAIHKIK